MILHPVLSAIVTYRCRYENLSFVIVHIIAYVIDINDATGSVKVRCTQVILKA